MPVDVHVGRSGRNGDLLDIVVFLIHVTDAAHQLPRSSAPHALQFCCNRLRIVSRQKRLIRKSGDLPRSILVYRRPNQVHPRHFVVVSLMGSESLRSEMIVGSADSGSNAKNPGRYRSPSASDHRHRSRL